MTSDNYKINGRFCWNKVQEQFRLRADGYTIYCRTAKRLEGSAKTALILKRKRLREEPDTTIEGNDQIVRTTSLVMPVLDGVNVVQTCAVTTTVTAPFTATAEDDQIIRTADPVVPALNSVHEGQASAATIIEAITVRQIATHTAATVRPASSTKHVRKGELTALEKEFVRDIGIKQTKEGKDVDQNYLCNAYEMAHEGYSREHSVLKKYWKNFKGGQTYKKLIKDMTVNKC